MERSDKTILVTGATGRQGGAVARHLLEDGWHVRGLTRHEGSAAAHQLAEKGLDVMHGDLTDPASVAEAVRGVYGVYSMQTPFESGPQAEEAMGVGLAEAAAEAGVEHFVYSSVSGAEQPSDLEWFASKRHVEDRIRELGLPATVWRPVTFMENFLRQKDGITAGTLSTAEWPETLKFYIAVDDIGRFVALAFREPERFVGSAMNIAGDSMDNVQTAETFSRVLGKPVEFVHVDPQPGFPEVPRPVPGVPQRVRADLQACRELIPDLVTLEQWIRHAGFAARSVSGAHDSDA